MLLTRHGKGAAKYNLWRETEQKLLRTDNTADSVRPVANSTAIVYLQNRKSKKPFCMFRQAQLPHGVIIPQAVAAFLGLEKLIQLLAVRLFICLVILFVLRHIYFGNGAQNAVKR